MILRLIVSLLVVVVVSGCGSMEPIPGDTFYRLKQSNILNSGEVSGPWTKAPLIIERFRANGIYKDRAIALLQQDDVSLTQSEYHYWNDSPEILLQERFLEHAISRRLADTVVLNSATGAEFVVTGRIIRFERVRAKDSSVQVSIQLELGIRRARGGREILFQEQFNFTDTVAGEQMSDVVALFSNGIDQLFSRFITKAGNALNQLPH